MSSKPCACKGIRSCLLCEPSTYSVEPNRDTEKIKDTLSRTPAAATSTTTTTTTTSDTIQQDKPEQVT